MWRPAERAAAGSTRSSGLAWRPTGHSLARAGAGRAGPCWALSPRLRCWQRSCCAGGSSRPARVPAPSGGRWPRGRRRSIPSSPAWNRRSRMRCPDLVSPVAVAALAALTVLALVPAAVRAQDTAQAAAMRAMIEQIARERPPQAEAAARDLLRQLQIERSALDSLRERSWAEYWGEVAQLTVQREMLMHQADSLRQKLMAQMFGQEARARALQRDYREAVWQTVDSARVRAIRERLQVLLERHFATEDSLRALEIADVERRLAQVRAETERRRRERAALVREMADQVLRDAIKP